MIIAVGVTLMREAPAASARPRIVKTLSTCTYTSLPAARTEAMAWRSSSIWANPRSTSSSKSTTPLTLASSLAFFIRSSRSFSEGRATGASSGISSPFGFSRIGPSKVRTVTIGLPSSAFSFAGDPTFTTIAAAGANCAAARHIAKASPKHFVSRTMIDPPYQRRKCGKHENAVGRRPRCANNHTLAAEEFLHTPWAAPVFTRTLRSPWVPAPERSPRSGRRLPGRAGRPARRPDTFPGPASGGGRDRPPAPARR